MAKIKIHEIAKKIGLTSKEIIEKANELGINVKSHLSSIEDEQAEKIEKSLANKKESKKNDKDKNQGKEKSKSKDDKKDSSKDTPAKNTASEPDHFFLRHKRLIQTTTRP